MKLNLIVVLACCFALASANLVEKIPDIETIKPDQLQAGESSNEYIDNLVNENIGDLNFIIEVFNALLSETQDEMNNHVAVLKSEIQFSAEQGIKYAEQMKIHGGDVAECASFFQSELNVIPTGKLDSIKECASSVFDALSNLGSEIYDSGSSAVKNVLIFKNLVMECVNKEGKIAKTRCVVSNVSEYKETIKLIINDAQEIISVLKDQGKTLIDAVKSCSLTRAQMALDEIQNIKLALDECKNV